MTKYNYFIKVVVKKSRDGHRHGLLCVGDREKGDETREIKFFDFPELVGVIPFP